ncbi:hypothetical protein B6V75_08285 [Thioclava sp. F1Mire-8]|uniref:hypothetical protein n=1 Tax=Thioclava sp. F1Mire-8 TaxID=1973006 RepID=UPI000B53E5E9|nr:hypothetical protein [Thioclava sp. F1Mire-8]OWY06076.1 hypothetical protein B6V75_08285 [Thioclava sp. F1Mire-8]
MGFETRSGKNYLYRRFGGTGKSLGPRSEHTEEKLARFKASREEIRHSLMVAWMNEMRRKAATRTMLTREIAKLSTLFRQR